MSKKVNYEEKRKSKRFLFSASDRVYGDLEFAEISDGLRSFRILDISAGGFQFTKARAEEGQISVGSTLTLHQLTGHPALDFVPRTRLEVKWILDNPIFKNILVGCQFIDIPEAVGHKIDQFVIAQEKAKEVVFCEECGNKNIIDSKEMAGIDELPIRCQICNNLISRETIISYATNFNSLDTSSSHLLLIDDDLGHLRIMAAMLKKKYHVTMAPTGKHGLELAQEINPDLILLDVHMPDMDGYEVCTRLKKNNKTRNIPVIFVTAVLSDDEEDKGLSVGGVDYITKPVNQQLLASRIAVQLKIKLLMDAHNKKLIDRDNLIASLKKNSLDADLELDALRQEKKNFETILNATDDLLFINNDEQQIVWASNKALEAFKTTLDDIVGRPCHSLLQANGSACEDCPLAGAGVDGYHKQIEVYSDRLDAKLILSHLPLFNDEGELTGSAHRVKVQTASK